jgi:hypothetical protein
MAHTCFLHGFLAATRSCRGSVFIALRPRCIEIIDERLSLSSYEKSTNQTLLMARVDKRQTDCERGGLTRSIRATKL